MTTRHPVPTIDDEQPSNDEARERAAQAQAESYYDEDLASFGWPLIGRGIILAGSAYPSALAAIYLVVGIVVAPFNNRLQNSVDATLMILFFGAVAFAIIAGIISLIWTGIVTVITLPVIHLVVWSMKLRAGLIGLGAFSGGLVAFLAVLPVTMQIPRMLHGGSAVGAVVMLLFGPGLATIVGQFGGAQGGRQAAFRLAAKMASRRALIAIGWRLTTANEKCDASESAANPDRPRFRFRTIHLMWVGVWISLLLTVIRLSGIPYELILPLLLGWLVYQAVTLVVGRLLARRLGPWWRGERQIRST